MAHSNEPIAGKSLIQIWNDTFQINPATDRIHTYTGNRHEPSGSFQIKSIRSSFTSQYGEESTVYRTKQDETADSNKINTLAEFKAYSKLPKKFDGYTNMGKAHKTFEEFTNNAAVDPNNSTTSFY